MSESPQSREVSESAAPAALEEERRATARALRHRESSQRALRQHVGAFFLFVAIALVVFRPLVANFTTHVTGNGIDDPALAWNLWWVKYSLVDLLNPDIFHVGWMFHPVQINLAFYTLTPLNALLSIPLQAAFGLVVANNLLLLFSFVLSAFGAYLLARSIVVPLLQRDLRPRENRDMLRGMVWLGCVLAGAIYAFAAPKVFYASLGQYNIASTQWIPFCAYYVIQLAAPQSMRSALRFGALAALFLVFQAWSELTYASFLLIFYGLAFVLGLWNAARRADVHLGAVFAGFATSAMLFVAGIAPILWAMLPDLRSEGDFFASASSSSSGGGFADLFSADLAGYLVPTRLNSFVGDWVASLPFPSEFGQQLFLGYVTIAVAITGLAWLWRRNRTTAVFWGSSTLLFWLLTLGPTLRWMGSDTGIPGPFLLVSQLPFFSANRYPSRYGVLLLLCVGVLAAAGIAALTLWVVHRNWSLNARKGVLAGATVVLLVLLAVEHQATVWITDFRIPSVYKTLAMQPGDKAVLELPTGWRNGARVLGRSDEVIMMQQWYQTEHEKRRLGGNTSRNPQHKFQYFTDHPLMGDLIALMNADQEYMTEAVNQELPAMIDRHREIAAQELADLGVGWVSVNVERSTPQLLEFVETMPLTLIEEWKGLDWSGEPSTIRLYAVEPWGTDDPRAIDLTDPAASAFLAKGWAWQSNGVERLAVRPVTELLLPLEPGSSVYFDTLGAVDAIRVNGAFPNRSTTGFEPRAYLSDVQGNDPVDRIRLQYAADNPDYFNPPLGTINLSVRSAAEQVGDFAEIWLNGVNVANGQRGYNLAAVDSLGNLIASDTFDTFASEGESARLADWIENLPFDSIVAGAVADEASLHLTQEGADALASLGVGIDLRGRFRWSHAFIGAIGAAPNSAQEEADVLRSVGVWQGQPQDDSAIHGALHSVTITYQQD